MNFGSYLFPPRLTLYIGVVGWCDGPGETSSAGASCNLGDSRTRAYCACSRCGWGLFGHFFSPLYFLLFSLSLGGWSGGAMALGELPVPGRPTIWITVRQGPTAL